MTVKDINEAAVELIGFIVGGVHELREADPTLSSPRTAETLAQTGRDLGELSKGQLVHLVLTSLVSVESVANTAAGLQGVTWEEFWAAVERAGLDAAEGTPAE